METEEVTTPKLKYSGIYKTSAIILICAALFYFIIIMDEEGSWTPDYPKDDLTIIISKNELSDSDYSLILSQTGLGRAATNKLLQDYNMNKVITEERFKQMQDDFFSSGNYKSERIGIITREDTNRDTNGKSIPGFLFADLRNGDILISKSTHSLGWRHGHAAIVTNASKGETVEAVLWGTDSLIQNANKWRYYASCIVLRLKKDRGEASDKIAEYAKQEMVDIPYGLFTGIPHKFPQIVEKTQCAHLVWYPYKKFGYDIDADGSWLVTPKDIANSDYLEIVQVFGIDPSAIWG